MKRRPRGAQRLRDRRLKLGFSMQALADRTGVSKETIRLWEDGRGVRGRNAVRVAEVLGIDPEEIILSTALPSGELPTLWGEVRDLRRDIRALHDRFDRLEELLERRTP